MTQLATLYRQSPKLPVLLDHISRKISLKAGSINTHKLALAGKIGLMTTLLYLALPGDGVNFPRGVSKCNMSQLDYGIVAMEHIASAIGP